MQICYITLVILQYLPQKIRIIQEKYTCHLHTTGFQTQDNRRASTKHIIQINKHSLFDKQYCSIKVKSNSQYKSCLNLLFSLLNFYLIPSAKICNKIEFFPNVAMYQKSELFCFEILTIKCSKMLQCPRVRLNQNLAEKCSDQATNFVKLISSRRMTRN